MGLMLGGPLLKPHGVAPVPSGVTQSSAFTLAGSLTDFSLLVDLSLLGAAWWNAIDTADFTKGRAYKADDTELAIDWINPVNNMDGTGSGHARVKWSGATSSGTLKIAAPVSTNASVAVGDTYGQYAAYDSMLCYVPMNEASGNITDRSAGRTGTASGTLAYGATGKVGDAIDFQTGVFTFGDIDAPLSAGLTVTAWFNPDVTNEIQNLILTDNDPSGSSAGLRMQAFSNGVIYCDVGIGSGYVRAFTNYSATMQHIAITYDGTDLKLYTGGSLVKTTSSAGTYSSGSLFNIGAKTALLDDFNGIIDEVAVQSTPRDANWISSEYSQTNDNGSFWGAWS